MICLRIEFLCRSTHYKWAWFHNFERPRTREGNIVITLNPLGGVCRSSSPSANSTYFHLMLSLTGSTFTGPNLHVKNSSELYVIFHKRAHCYMVSRGREPTHLSKRVGHGVPGVEVRPRFSVLYFMGWCFNKGCMTCLRLSPLDLSVQKMLKAYI